MGTIGVQNKMNLTIEHVPTGQSVEFAAYLENLADLYTSQWNAEDVYGRMDPITTFMFTKRSYSISWNVPANSYIDAKENLVRVNKLMSFLYPLYSNKSGAKGATAINQAPLLRISFGNLIRNSATGGGLLGYCNGFTFDPRVENGMFHHDGDKGMEYYPKTILLNTEFNVLHEHELGFQKKTVLTEGGNNTTSFSFRNKNLNERNYPYYSSKIAKEDRTVGIHTIQVTDPYGVVRNNSITSTDPGSVNAALGSGRDPGEEK
tara:strand:- start:2387 stop:3172 length:786 start_codon:yes stop_codon:yes gene_type:complete